MRIVQLSDLHVKSGRAYAFNAADSSSVLEETVSHLAAMDPAPDCIVISGDIAEHGEQDAYDFARRTLERLRIPVYVIPGNHDNRERLRDTLRAFCPADPAVAPYVCYTVDAFPLRLVMVDSSHPGSHSGHLHAPVARWLEKTLAANTCMPTLVFMHHPPFRSALGVMDEPFQGADELGAILAANPQARLCCGHMHRGIATTWRGVTGVVCPPLVLPIVLDLSPGGGDLFTLGPPSYLLHHYFDGQINAHFCQLPGTWEYAGPYSFSNPPA
ncbi:phosphodiesterase [Desulfovibrio sp. OttesenSCG-928-I05]|nr:phosphodiesterase [Desulfovibrio sp. OttesenSCG-928-I05]